MEDSDASLHKALLDSAVNKTYLCSNTSVDSDKKLRLAAECAYVTLSLNQSDCPCNQIVLKNHTKRVYIQPHAVFEEVEALSLQVC